MRDLLGSIFVVASPRTLQTLSLSLSLSFSLFALSDSSLAQGLVTASFTIGRYDKSKREQFKPPTVFLPLPFDFPGRLFGQKNEFKPFCGGMPSSYLPEQNRAKSCITFCYPVQAGKVEALRYLAFAQCPGAPF